MRVVASLFISFLRFHFYGFSFLFLCSRCFLPPAVPDHVELYGDIAQTESLCNFAGPEV